MRPYALVTASTRGIGKAIGIALLQKGYYVFFNYAHNQENAYLLKTELETKYPNQFAIIQADLSTYDAIEVLHDKVKEVTQVLDTIILNAGVTCKTSFQAIQQEEWAYVFDTNLKVPFFILQRIDPMINKKGKIIFISSHLGLIPHAISIPYAVSKSASIMLAKSLVKVYKDREITVNVVAPGFIDTEWHQNKTPTLRKKIENKIALRRFGQPEDIASACDFIIENDYINGAVLQVDGGYNME